MRGVVRRLGFILIIAVLAPRVVFADAANTVDTVRLLVGRSTVVDIGTSITRVSLTSADIADALVTGPSQLLVHGKTPGTISMFVWEKSGTIRRYEVTVHRDLSRLSEQLHQLFPAETIAVAASGKDVVLSGAVSSEDVRAKAATLATGYVEKKDEVVNLMTLQETQASNQVLLRVRFAEVSRSALTQFGLSGAANGAKDGRWFGRVATEQFPAPQWDEQGKFVFSDFLNLFLFDTKNELAGVVKALQNRGLFQTLAEPNLVSESGKEASFLAGGEFPIPVAQPGGGSNAITVTFKEFGIRLTFTPTVTGADRVHLKVRPEVSTLDFANGVALNGFRIPALSTRRTETELELNDGQTFAIAGLLNNQVNQSLQKIPGIGDIPILGQLFRTRAAQKDQTELVVMITPQILPRNSRGVTPNLPRLQENYLPAIPQNRSREVPPPAFVPGGSGSAAAPADQSPESAAAAVSALTPKTRTVVNGNGRSKKQVPASEATRPLTAQEKKVLERAHELERARAERDARVAAEEQKRAAKQAGEEYRRQKAEQERQAKIAREQAKKQAAIDAENARQAAEQAKKQAEADKKAQKTIADAEAKLKAAQAAYEAEVSKKDKR